jgi:hypothetical protein
MDVDWIHLRQDWVQLKDRLNLNFHEDRYSLGGSGVHRSTVVLMKNQILWDVKLCR